jgi:uncharacterized membrane protein
VVKVTAILVLVFALGAATGGAVVYATRAAPTPASEPPTSVPIAAEERADRLTRRLRLSPEQRALVVEILRGHQARLRAARGALLDEVGRVLDDEQRRKFHALTRKPE